MCKNSAQKTGNGVQVPHSVASVGAQPQGSETGSQKRATALVLRGRGEGVIPVRVAAQQTLASNKRASSSLPATDGAWHGGSAQAGTRWEGQGGHSHSDTGGYAVPPPPPGDCVSCGLRRSPTLHVCHHGHRDGSGTSHDFGPSSACC